MKLTATHGIIAMKGSGKTYRAMALAESMLESGGQVVAIDPTGAWWGLRLHQDGKRVHFPQLLVLGANGSLPLSDTMGEAVAHLVVNQRISVVLDLSAMSKAGMRRFVAAFLLEIYRVNPNRPLHTFVDEADLFAPEHAQGEAANCTGAMSDYFRRGRRKGLGGTIITQRVQAVSKDVLWQCEAMTILRLKGTHDIKAIKDWLDSNGFDAAAIAAALPRLKKGDRYFCGDEHAEFFAKGSDQRKTYDSSRTPEPGDDSFTPPTLDDTAIEAIKAQLGEAAAELQANDPKALKAEIARLKRELAAGNGKAIETKVVKVEVPVLDGVSHSFLENYRDTLKHAAEVFDERLKRGEELLGGILDHKKRLEEGLARDETASREDAKVARRREELPAASVSSAKSADSAVPGFNGELSGKRGGVLEMIARAGRPLDRTQLAILTGYTYNSRTFSNHVGALRTEGMLTGDWPIQLTDQGRKRTAGVSAPVTKQELREMWRAQLVPKTREMFDIVLQHGPLDRQTFGALSGYEYNSRTFSNHIGRLRTLGLITKAWPVDVVGDLKD
jgi:hypothetical protein